MNTEILLYEGFEELDTFGPFEVLAAGGLHPTLVTLEPTDHVTGGHGATIVPHAALGERPALLLIPGGGWAARRDRGAWAQAQDGTLPRAIAARHANGAVVAGVCTGAMLIAAAGILADRPAITHHSALQDLAAAGSDVIAQARVVDDGDIVTCGGVTAGIDLALTLVQRVHGGPAAQRVAELIEYRRQGDVHVGPGAARWSDAQRSVKDA